MSMIKSIYIGGGGDFDFATRGDLGKETAGTETPEGPPEDNNQILKWKNWVEKSFNSVLFVWRKERDS